MMITDGMFSWFDAMGTALTSALAVYLISWLRPPPHTRDHSGLLTLLKDLFESGRHKTDEGRLILEEACAQLYRRYVSLEVLPMLLRCASPAQAIRTYAKYASMLEAVPEHVAIRFKRDKAPYRIWRGRKVPAAMLKGTTIYLAMIVPALYLAQLLVRNAKPILSTDNVSMIVTLICLCLIAAMLFVGSITALFAGMNAHHAEKEITKDLGPIFVSDSPQRFSASGEVNSASLDD